MDKCLCLTLQMVGACVPVKQNIQKMQFSICYLALVAGTQIAQSRAIERFVAKYSGLYTYHDPVAAAHVDAVLDAVEDLSEALMKCTRGIDPKSPEYLEKRQECATTGTRS